MKTITILSIKIKDALNNRIIKTKIVMSSAFDDFMLELLSLIEK